MDLSNFREEYLKGQLHRKDLAENPFEQFQTWFEQALKADIPEPNAFSLATVNAHGRPSLRTVLLKYFDQTGFVFFTNYGSHKAHDIEENPQVCMMLPWVMLERQVINVGDEVEFVVPTGNFGDILAGYYAKLLGLPVKHLVVASDKNNVLFDFLTSGTYNRQRPFFQTISPSMDILISSNLERMLYYMSDKDTRLISMLMNDLSQWGAYEVPEPMMKKIRSIFGTGWADENQVREMIADCWNKNHYVIDPHTACGYYVMQQMPRDPLTPRVLLSTASPYKFPRVVNESLGLDASGTDFECMDVLAKATGTTAPAALRGLETADVRFDHVVDIDGMEGFVEQAAKAL